MRYETVEFTVYGDDANEIEHELTKKLGSYGSTRGVRHCTVTARPNLSPMSKWLANVAIELQPIR